MSGAYRALTFDGDGTLWNFESAMSLALVTNGNTHPHRTGLDGLFETVVVAAERGLHKPDPEIYRITVDRLCLDACEVLHVGDDPVEDVIAWSKGRIGHRLDQSRRPRMAPRRNAVPGGRGLT